RQSMDTLAWRGASDPEYRARGQGLADVQMALSRQVRERAAVEEELQATRQAIDATRNALQGRTDGCLARLKNSISGRASFKARIDQLVGRFDNIMEDLIYVMSAFPFRTLLMPLVFLYAFLKGFRLIWGVDLRTALQRGHAEMRRELRPGGREA